MRYLIVYIVAVTYILFNTSCGLSDNEQPMPAFISLHDPTVKMPTGTGFDTHKITEVWVFADGQILGVFPLPAMVPLSIVGDGDVEISILAGIRNSGINDTPVFYPFYKSIIQVITPEIGATYDIPLQFEYTPGTKIPINESFEASNVFTTDLDNNIDTNFEITNLESTLGSSCALVSLTSSLSFFEVGSAIVVQSGDNARGASYLEMDYKGDGEIAIGLIKSLNQRITLEYFLFVPGKTDWNKIYVDLTDKLSITDYDAYAIAIGFTKTGNSTTSKLYLDNIKHIHF